MLHYIYDGTFEGLLTCIYRAYYSRQIPDQIVCGDIIQENLMDQYSITDTDKIKADKVLSAIRTKISEDALSNVFHSYLSDVDDIGIWIYRYLKLGWRVGSSIDSYLHEDAVLKIHEICRKVRFEGHRMQGLIRFRELKGDIYYAPIGPDHNILPLVAPHFSRRLADQSWMIHDVKRDIAALYNQNDWIISDIRQKKALPLHEDELGFQRLWKQYFQAIAITGRKNTKLQRQHMPSRYWRFLVEKY